MQSMSHQVGEPHLGLNQLETAFNFFTVCGRIFHSNYRKHWVTSVNVTSCGLSPQCDSLPNGFLLRILVSFPRADKSLAGNHSISCRQPSLFKSWNSRGLPDGVWKKNTRIPSKQWANKVKSHSFILSSIHSFITYWGFKVDQWLCKF